MFIIFKSKFVTAIKLKFKWAKILKKIQILKLDSKYVVFDV